MLVSRSSFENPSPLDRLVRMISPSSTSTLCPSPLSSPSINLASVVLPAPDRPVNQIVKPFPAICFSKQKLFKRQPNRRFPQTYEYTRLAGIGYEARAAAPEHETTR